MSEPAIGVVGGEREVVNVAFARQSIPFALALTDRAVYFTEVGRWWFNRKSVVRRIPIEQVTRVSVQRTPLSRVALMSVLMIASGGILLFLMTLQFRQGFDRAYISLVPVGLIFVGLALPFTARGHRTLRIEFVSRPPYRWRPPLFMAQVTKRHVEYLMERIVKAFRSLRIYVSEESA